MIIIPNITEHTRYGEQSTDLWSKLFANRIISISGHIESETADLVVGQLLFLEAQDQYADIYMYINSPGGSVIAGNSILDVMDYIKCDVFTIGLGQCDSMAAVLLSNGTPGKRLCFERTEIMIHQVKSSFISGQAADIKLRAERIDEMNNALIATLAKNCNKSVREMEQYTDRDYFMSSAQALNFGLVDEIIN